MMSTVTKRLIISLCLILFSPVIGFSGTRRVQGESSGKYYNDVWGEWFEYPIIVYVSDFDGTTYIKGGENLLTAKVNLSEEERQKVVNSLMKSSEWVEIAKKEQLEVQKELYVSYGLYIEFFSANKGQQTDVVLSIREDSVNKINLYLNQFQVLSLISLLEEAPPALNYLRQENERAERLLGTRVQEEVQDEAQDMEINNLKLIGINWSDRPDVMIENTVEMKTYLLKKGDMIGEYKIEEINRTSVMLRKENYTFELRQNNGVVVEKGYWMIEFKDGIVRQISVQQKLGKSWSQICKEFGKKSSDIKHIRLVE